VSLDVETGEVLRVLAEHPPPDNNTGAGRIEGLSLTPDGTTATEPYVELLSPDWQATTGKLGAVAWCCYGSDPEESVPFHALLLDPETGASETLLAASAKPSWIDFDMSGRKLLWVENQGRLVIQEGTESGTIGENYEFATW
jgi:hypothetical protein